MTRSVSIVALFATAVAAISAAAGDLLVESLSNHGFFGPGRFTDGSTVDVAPVAIIGTLLLVAYFGKRLWEWRTASAALTNGSIAKLFPAIFMLHMALLWSMETLEQRIVTGRLLGGTIWLGGPTLASLALHALLCAVIAWFALALVRFIEPRTLRLIRALLALAIFPAPALPAIAIFSRPVRVASRVFVHGVGKRGPPVPSA
jgi:hypothetical protein